MFILNIDSLTLVKKSVVGKNRKKNNIGDPQIYVISSGTTIWSKQGFR